MGNRLCKKKGDVVDNGKHVNNISERDSRSPSRFDRIITRLHLKPTTWKSESHLNKKEHNRSKSEERKHGESIFYTKPISKSSDWTDVDLEVPSNDDDHIHLRNPKLNLIFDNDKGTPTPPPRKQQKGSNFRETIEKIATKSLQVLQGDKNKDNSNQVPIEEPLMVKKKINYNCPVCDGDEKNHNRDHHHHDNIKKGTVQPPTKPSSKNSKRQKNLSVISLPNYTDLKLSVADPVDLDQKASSKNNLNSSRLSLQNPGPKKLTSSQSTGKLDSYITRCRSFGSIFPQQLKKLRLQKTKPEDITSDDSFGPLEDWDVGLIEHYNPKDASLPRPRKQVPDKSANDVLEGIADLIINEEEIEALKPKRPVRRVESLVKKINKEASKQQGQLVAKSPEDICLTPPPSPVHETKDQTVGPVRKVAEISKNFEENVEKKVEDNIKPIVVKRNKEQTVKTDEPQAVKSEAKLAKRQSVNEHSSLMKILQEFSVKDKQENAAPNNAVENDSNMSSLTPSLVEFEKTLNNNILEDFINSEKSHSRAVFS